ncbi:hypothetical protein [Pyrococcus woesei]|uniref:hypothetical protein n=1 Tax=Pyrococcus woesei TaxID=2262 RepID=UPI001987E8C2|nr:hypothetical protein [Methanomassiliicoccales archaeon]
MKTIAVDEETWNAIKKLKTKLDARSYDEVLRILIETWHSTNLNRKLDEISLDDEEGETALKILKQLKEKED